MSLFSNFRIKTDVCGLDIGSTAIRAAQLKYPKQHAPLFSLAEATLSKKIFDKNTLADSEGFGTALDSLMQSGTPHPITAKAVVAALPETYIFTRVIQLPHLPPAELHKAIPYEVGQYLPVPIEEVYYDYTPLALRPDKKQIDVAMFAAPKTLVDPLISVIHAHGLELYALETKSTAVARALIPAGIDQAILIIELGSSAARMTVVDHGDVWLAASLSGGTTEILRILSEKTGHDQTNLADKLAHEQTPAIKAALDQAVGPIVQEAIAVTRYHETRDFHPNKLHRVLVIGQGAAIPGVVAAITNLIHMPCELGVPLVTDPNPIDVKFSVALGLSMRSL